MNTHQPPTTHFGNALLESLTEAPPHWMLAATPRTNKAGDEAISFVALDSPDSEEVTGQSLMLAARAVAMGEHLNLVPGLLQYDAIRNSYLTRALDPDFDAGCIDILVQIAVYSDIIFG